MHGNLTGAYDIRHVSVRNRVVLTNKTPTGLNRGFGGPQVYYALERLMQRIAVELSLDPIDVIRSNLVPSGAFPYRTASGALLDSGDYAQRSRPRWRMAARRTETAPRRSARARPHLRHRLYRRGRAERLEYGLHHDGADAGGAPQGRAEERRAGDGDGDARSARRGLGPRRLGAAGAGPSHRAVADRRRRARPEAFGHSCRHRDSTPRAMPGRSPPAIIPAASRRRSAAPPILPPRGSRTSSRSTAPRSSMCPPDEIEFAGGRVRARGNPDNAFRSPASPPPATGRRACCPTDNQALRETAFWTPPELTPPTEHDEINSSLCHGFIFDFCGVEIDRVTGAVRIDNYVTMHDCGRILHPGDGRGPDHRRLRAGDRRRALRGIRLRRRTAAS